MQRNKPAAVVPLLHMAGERPTLREVVRWCIAMLDADLLYHFDDDVQDIIFDTVTVTPGDRALLAAQVDKACSGDFDQHHAAIVAIRYRQRFPKGAHHER